MKKVLVAALLCGAAFGQSVPASFDAADIRVSGPSANTNIRGGVVRGGRYEVSNATMVQLISMAYNIKWTPRNRLDGKTSAARAGD